MKVVGATLWTDFNHVDPFVMMDFKKVMTDARLIKPKNNNKLIENEMLDLFKLHFKYIEDKKPDIVITHHAPSFRSIVPKFQRDFPSNFYYYSELDYFIEQNQNIKLWIHGHTHGFADYMIGNTRVICNPLGYPHELKVVDYQMVNVEL
jgi:Icc-related predicted phosphoesterase